MVMNWKGEIRDYYSVVMNWKGEIRDYYSVVMNWKGEIRDYYSCNELEGRNKGLL